MSSSGVGAGISGLVAYSNRCHRWITCRRAHCQPVPHTRGTLATIRNGQHSQPRNTRNLAHTQHAPTRPHGGMPARRGVYIRIGVFLGVLFCVLLSRCVAYFVLRKNGKKEVCQFGCFFAGGQASVCECVRSNVCATGIAPTLHSL